MGQAQWKHDIALAIWTRVAGDDEDAGMPSEAYVAASAMMEHVPFGDSNDADDYVGHAVRRGQLKISLHGDVFEWSLSHTLLRKNPVGDHVDVTSNPAPRGWKTGYDLDVAFPDEGENASRVIAAGDWDHKTGSGSDLRGLRDVSFSYKTKQGAENAMDRIAALRIGGLHASLKIYDWDADKLVTIREIGKPRRNPVGDHVDVTSGPGRGRSGVVKSETKHVARVQFDKGGSGHVERGALRTRGRPGRD
jgi:hypothetical protein